MNVAKTIWDGLDWSVLVDILLRFVPALLCITLHEIGHGFIAWKLGDPTAKNAGRLTLNPLRHIDVFGLIMMVVFRIGWAKPVMVDMRRFRNPKQGMALTAMAGPAVNLLIVLILLPLYGFFYIPLLQSDMGGYVLELLSTTIYLSLMLAVFNLFPIPPLDGSKILFALLPDRYYLRLMRYERYGMLLLIVLVSTGILSTPLNAVLNGILDGLSPVLERCAELSLRVFGYV